ncbi:MAG: energy transducer TonB [Bdellovibrionales bacterium]
MPAKPSPPVALFLEQKTPISEKALNNFPNTNQTNQTNQKPSKQANSYSDDLISFIQSQAVYPRAALALKQEGTVTISLTLNKRGTITYFELITPSKHNSLTSAALKLAKNLKQYKPLPWSEFETKSFIIPIHYILN